MKLSAVRSPCQERIGSAADFSNGGAGRHTRAVAVVNRDLDWCVELTKRFDRDIESGNNARGFRQHDRAHACSRINRPRRS
jgi:hypothetical protein